MKIADYHPAMTAGKWTAAALVAMLAFPATAPIYRAPVPITFHDKTSGFNGIEECDLKYLVCRPQRLGFACRDAS